MGSIFESEAIVEMAKPLRDSAKHLEVLFPNLEWDLKKAGYAVDTIQYLSVVLYLTLSVFVGCVLLVMLPLVGIRGQEQLYGTSLFSITISILAFAYLLVIPKSRIGRRARLIDMNLEFMLKDIQIQLTSGVTLFDTMVNVARGQYGECSSIANGIVQEVESGRAIPDVLDDVGMWSPSEYLRKVMWQIVNAVKSGSDVLKALEYIANDIRLDKEAKIKAYGQELNLWSLLYMMGAIIMPSMGVTLLVILSSFMGGAVINESLFWLILCFLCLFQAVFLSYVKNKRPQV